MCILKSLGGLMVSTILTGCSLFSPTGATPTRALNFVTVTPITTDTAASPTPTVDTAIPPIPIPTSPPPLPTTSPTATLGTPLSTPLFPSPSPIVLTPTPIGQPYAIIDSPGGSLNVRAGPGSSTGTPLGTYTNGATVDILGKQYSNEGRLWWLIPFPTSPTGQGWVFADYTIAYNVDKVPWVNPGGPIPTYIPPDPLIPHVIIDSPNGFAEILSGPGEIYKPPLGTARNGTIFDILGKQLSKKGELWWLIFFPSVPYQEGWVYANYTIGKYTEGAPWISAPPTPTATPTTTPTGQPIVEWIISGRVIDAVTIQPIVGASVRAELGDDGTSLITVTDSNGNFSFRANATDRGDLVLIITAQDYTDRVVSTAPRTPRTYNFPNIELTPTKPPAVTWAISGRVTEVGTVNPIPGAQIEAVLGLDAIRLGTVTDSNGQFSISGDASNSGSLTINITADGYQPNTIVSDQTDSRIYTLNNLQLVPLANSCLYESVLGLVEATALTRLQNLNFSNVSTTTIVTDSSIGQVLTQQPEPPPEGEAIRVGCQIPITLGIGAN